MVQPSGLRRGLPGHSNAMLRYAMLRDTRSHTSFVIMQYRVDGGAGFWRNFDVNNQTQTRDVVYLVESVFHEMMLQVLQCDALRQLPRSVIGHDCNNSCARLI